MALDPISAVLETGTTIINKIWPDASEVEKAKLSQFMTEFTARANIVQTEAASNHWLAANWRPLLMLTFGWLIVSRWYGWAAPNLSEAEYLKLWDIVELGLGGYVVGRSAEKVLPSIATIIKGK